MKNYSEIWKSTGDLHWCVLVTTGRVGSDFFQSLIDSHPEVFSFNGVIDIHQFWKTAKSTNNKKHLYLDDIINEFIGQNIHKFKSIYDLQEKKDKLGENQNESINIDLNEFKLHLNQFLKNEQISCKNFLRATYLSWACCRKENIFEKKIFFHHIHHIWKLKPFLDDFPNSKILSMTRDPRASYVSGVENWNKYSDATKHPSHVFFVLNRTINDAIQLKNFNNDFRVLKLEDLGKKSVLNNFCLWLNINYNESMETSTWNGLRWWGDLLSQRRIKTNEPGFSKSIIENKWEKKLGSVEKVILNFLLYSRLKHYGYEYNNKFTILQLLICIFLIPLPTKFEWEYISPIKLSKLLLTCQFRYFLFYIYYYLLRVKLFYNLLLNRILSKKFDLPIIKE